MKRTHYIILIFAIALAIWSYVNAYGLFEWFSLAAPGLAYIIVLVITYRKFQFTTFTYLMILLHIFILFVGAKYTYTYNPLFEYLEEMFNLSRNHYDRVGHLAQGFVPIFIAKEIILKNNYMERTNFFYFVLYLIILGISGFYELLEFGMCLITGHPASFILAHQGDMWDTQWDMVMALVGATLALLLFSRIHDRFMGKD